MLRTVGFLRVDKGQLAWEKSMREDELEWKKTYSVVERNNTVRTAKEFGLFSVAMQKLQFEDGYRYSLAFGKKWFCY